jgi:tetratricopeptide (TPR) repeat protein
MDKESASFWPDIKKYEDMLANDPKSYCFTILAELYRKVGLLDDAINIANGGIETHPEYVGGYMAVGRAYFEKGMKEESRKSLERVVRVTPDNLLAQKLLSQIYVEQGDIPSAIRTLQVVELLNPEDMESRLMLDNLTKASLASEEDCCAEGVSVSAPEEEIATTDCGFVFSADMVETEPFEQTPEVAPLDESPALTSHKDPLATATLAELYVSQGFLDRAIDVYRELLETGPDNERFRDRLEELESNISVQVSQSETPDADILLDHSPFAVEEGNGCSIEVRDFSFRSGGEDGIISLLEYWLDNIKRGRYAAEGDTQKYC